MTVTEKKGRNIMQRLNSVMKKVDYVKKDKAIGKGGYAYNVATYDQIISVVRLPLVAAGIVVVTNQTGPGRLVPTGTFYGGGQDGKGIEALRYEAMYAVDFVNIDNPEDKVTFTVEAHAIDQGDKAPGKAQTYATKAAIKKALLLESGDEEESRADVTGGNGGGETFGTTVIPTPQPTQQRPAARAEPANKDSPVASEGQVKFIGRKLEAAQKSEAELLTRIGRTALAGMSEADAKVALEWIAGKIS